ncbi:MULTISPECIES: methionine/alanine import family NSS transporter small subunit [Nesterenkonia]|uniref:Putative methionine/alanine importer small subunit n=1 Tax=Nesterenkonia aurantiaca TaxID=1436010 RepID=A0A4R7G3J2_9MICC|nr:MULTISPECIES: methionine/alanine import family NSS transporter small subunit [Nesterenkonia]TDS85811.1 putative methionine/alanine importer small subunit [Nesterenkonia aurantiaca]
MDTDALIMMIVALATVWGGLAAAVAHLRRHPDGS